MLEIKGLYRKISALRKEFHSQSLKPSGRNDFSKYTYFEKGDFIPRAMELMDKYGLCAIVQVLKDEATIRIVDCDDDKELVITAPCAEAAIKGASPIQQMGALQTYMNRYLWMTFLEICETDIVNSTTPMEKQASFSPVKPSPVSTPTPKPVPPLPEEESLNQEEIKEIEAFAEECSSIASFSGSTAFDIEGLREKVSLTKGTVLFPHFEKTFMRIIKSYQWKYDKTAEGNWIKLETPSKTKIAMEKAKNHNAFGGVA